MPDPTPTSPASAELDAELVAAEAAQTVEHRLPLATVVTADGVAVRLHTNGDGGLIFAPAGNRAPLSFDRFQRAALRMVLEALA